MEISWRIINEDANRLVEEFEKLYTYDRDYTKCKKFITDFFKVYATKYNIKLDENPDFHHVFQQVLAGMKDVIDGYTPTDLTDQVQSQKIDELFRILSEKTLNTADIRDELRKIDPSNYEFIKALEQGIVDSTKRRDEIDGYLSKVKKIRVEIFGDSDPDLRAVTDAELDSLGHFDNISNYLNQIDALIKATNTMSDGNDKTNNLKRIDELKKKIETEKTRIKNTNLVDEKELDLITSDNIPNSLAKVSTLRSNLDSRTTTDFTTIKQNLENAKNKYPNIYTIAGIDVSALDPSTENGRKAIREAYRPFMSTYDALEQEREVYDREITIFGQQINQIREEQKIMDLQSVTRDKLKNDIPQTVQSKVDSDMAFYEDLVRAQMYGNPAFKKKYDDYLKIFKDNVVANNSFDLCNFDGTPILDTNGNPKRGTYSTVDYDGISRALAATGSQETVEDLLKFLQLEDYKAKLERTSKIEAGDMQSFNQYKGFAEAIAKASTPAEKEQVLNDYISSQVSKDKVYLSTYHYATNDYEFLRQHHLTGGKIAETYIPYLQHQKGEGLGEKIKIEANNIRALSRWRSPLEPDPTTGQPNVVHGIANFAKNIGNLGLFLPRAGVKLTGTIVSRVKYGKNVGPNPYNGRGDARRGARVDWYRENGDGAFTSRAKGWIDEIFSKRRTETEEKIMDRQLEEIKKGLIDSYIDGAFQDAVSELEEQKNIVRRNREIRSRDARAIAGSKETQGDIFRDPDNADQKTLSQRSMQRVALEYSDVDTEYVNNTGSRNPANNPMRNTQFAKDKPDLEGKTEIKGVKKADELGKVKWGRKKGGVVAADPIGRAIRSREIKNTLTRLYMIEELALAKGQSALARWGISKIGNTVWRDTGRTEDIDLGTTHKEQTGYHWDRIGTQQEATKATDIKMGDLQYTDTAYFEHSASSGFPTGSWFEKPTSANIQAMSIDFKVPSDLTPGEYSILAQKYGLKAGDTVSYSIADKATKWGVDNIQGANPFSNSYIDGMFNFTNDTNISGAVNQYFPQEISGPWDIVLNSPSYAGEKGMHFLEESFSTAHGVKNVMRSMEGWGTGWAIEGIKAEAKKTAHDLYGYVPDYTDVADIWHKPIFELVKDPNAESVKPLKKMLNRILNGLGIMEIGGSVYDLARPATTKKETGRETYDDSIR